MESLEVTSFESDGEGEGNRITLKSIELLRGYAEKESVIPASLRRELFIYSESYQVRADEEFGEIMVFAFSNCKVFVRVANNFGGLQILKVEELESTD